jgi:hypothetical protein
VSEKRSTTTALVVAAVARMARILVVNCIVVVVGDLGEYG